MCDKNIAVSNSFYTNSNQALQEKIERIETEKRERGKCRAIGFVILHSQRIYPEGNDLVHLLGNYQSVQNNLEAISEWIYNKSNDVINIDKETINECEKNLVNYLDDLRDYY